ncbi:MAG: hypothetical protein NTV21_12905 [Planctomycetota bacterium]|nr:hypothetical protein [Planctomycetota bacterium]
MGVRCAVALVALALLLASGARVRAGRETVVHSVAVFALVLLAPAFEVALEVGGVRGARAEWFDACVAAGPLGFAWNSLALGAEVGLPRAVASLAAPVLVFALVQLTREKEPQP